MPRLVDIGDKSAQCADVTTLAVRPGDSVVVTNAAVGDVVNYFTNLASAAAGTIALSGSQTFTTPAWLTSNSRSSIQISGGIYGS